MRDLERQFDFSRDYVVLNELGGTLFDRARAIRSEDRQADRDALLRASIDTFGRTLAIDSENVTAHYNLALLYQFLGDEESAERHRELHQRYKPDDNITERAIPLARRQYPAANHAAEALVIYPLQRPAAPGLPEEAQ